MSKTSRQHYAGPRINSPEHRDTRNGTAEGAPKRQKRRRVTRQAAACLEFLSRPGYDEVLSGDVKDVIYDAYPQEFATGSGGVTQCLLGLEQDGFVALERVNVDSSGKQRIAAVVLIEIPEYFQTMVQTMRRERLLRLGAAADAPTPSPAPSVRLGRPGDQLQTPTGSRPFPVQYPAICQNCGESVGRGEMARYDGKHRLVHDDDCQIATPEFTRAEVMKLKRLLGQI
jgi:hypothetical protein